MLLEFLKEADLSTEQEKRVRAELQQRVRDVMQLTADYTNGDLDGDAFYDAAAAAGDAGNASLRSFLDEGQAGVLDRFHARLTTYVGSYIVSGEVANMRSRLRLDPDQERKITAIVKERYRRVQEGIPVPIPNVMMKPIRRSADEPIYRETGDRIRALLTPDQAALFDDVERTQTEQIYEFRSNLVPK
jgi:hypothetical protein